MVLVVASSYELAIYFDQMLGDAHFVQGKCNLKSFFVQCNDDLLFPSAGKQITRSHGESREDISFR
jgi:hypothetical protein